MYEVKNGSVDQKHLRIPDLFNMKLHLHSDIFICLCKLKTQDLFFIISPFSRSRRIDLAHSVHCSLAHSWKKNWILMQIILLSILQTCRTIIQIKLWENRSLLKGCFSQNVTWIPDRVNMQLLRKKSRFANSHNYWQKNIEEKVLSTIWTKYCFLVNFFDSMPGFLRPQCATSAFLQ